MIINKDKVVTVAYDMYVGGENGEKEELMQRVKAEQPYTYLHGEGMMLPLFEQALEGKQDGDTFDFRIDKKDAYGEYDEKGLIDMDKHLFYNGDGEFDAERVFVGNVVPMNTEDGGRVLAQVVEITDDKVTIDLNHPLAGENLHFTGSVIEVREATAEEIDMIRHPHCGGCGGSKCHSGKKGKGCGSEGCCGGCE